MSSNFSNYRLNIKYSERGNIFLSINCSTRSNNDIDENSRKITNIEKLEIIDNANNICGEELLFLLLSNSRSLKYYRYINY